MADLTFLTPELTLVGTGLAVLLIGLFINTKARRYSVTLHLWVY
jgi:hypothetical protein